MSNIAWCDLNNKSILRYHDFYTNPKFKCQKPITFTPIQFQMEGAGFKNTMKKGFRGIEKMWNSFIKQKLKIATPFI